MATASECPPTIGAAANRKRTSREVRENKVESSKDLLTKADKRKCSSRQTRTKSIPTEKPEHVSTSQPTWRQTRGKNAEKMNRQRAPIAPKEGRYLRVAAVNQTKSDQDKRLKSTTNWGHPPGPTACTHPTINTTSTMTAASRGTRKTKTSIPPTAAYQQGATRIVKRRAAPNGQRCLPSSSITVPDVVAEAVQCPKKQTDSQLSSLEDSVAIVKVERPPQLERKDVPDPDKGTESDPCLCGEYIKDIYTYLLKLEARPVYAIGEDFLSHQVEVRRQHRNILVDWLVQVHQRFILLPETLYLAIDILDRTLQVSSSFTMQSY